MPIAPISVVIPAYNASRYIDESIASVLAQTVDPQEIIVINDGSTDDTLDRLRNYADRIKVYSQENQGLAKTLNVAIGQATAEFIAFLDSDDLWEANKLARQLEFMQEHPNYDACFTHLQQFISPDLPPDVQAGIDCPIGPQAGYVKITLLIRRSVFEQVGLFDPTLTIGDFVEWFSRAKHVGLQYGILPDVLAHRRIHRSSLGAQTQHHHEYARVMKAHLDRRRAGLA